MATSCPGRESLLVRRLAGSSKTTYETLKDVEIVADQLQILFKTGEASVADAVDRDEASGCLVGASLTLLDQ